MKKYQRIRMLFCFLCGIISVAIIEIGIGFINFYKNIHQYDQVKHISEIRERIIKDGDTMAYRHFVDSCQSTSLRPYSHYLFFSIVMANKYNYVPANYDIYVALNDVFLYNKKLGKMDKKTKALSIFYLKRGAYRGYQPAIIEMKKLRLAIPLKEPSVKPILDEIEHI
jgi:hypothetical protein